MFFNRLRAYYQSIGVRLKEEASSAAIFPNPSDRGSLREQVYYDFLRDNIPSKCSIFFGGYLFDDRNGDESKQLDIIITTDTAPRFTFGSKGFSPVEGTLGVISVKSTLDKSQLIDALLGFASIPLTQDLGGRINPLMPAFNYDDWPLKIIYASNGIAPATLLSHLNEFYAANPHIPATRRPNIIHVAGQCLIYRAEGGMVMYSSDLASRTQLVKDQFYLFEEEPDLQAISEVLRVLQQRALYSTHILFSYNTIFDGVKGVKN